MPILLLLVVGLGFPRIAIVLLWFFTGWFSNVAIDWLLGILAFLIMPYTLLWYSAVMNWYGGVWGFWQLVFLFIAIVADLSSLFASGKYYYTED